MKHSEHTLIIRFSTVDDRAYRVDLEGPEVGDRHGEFSPPYDPATWVAILRALEPAFSLEEADEATQAALKPLGDLAGLQHTVGTALADALLADEGARAGFDVALSIAEKARRPLSIEVQFGQGCDSLAAMPWELLRYKDRFLVGDTSVALSRYPAGAIPLTPALTELPLRVLLVLSEPADASPIFPQEARRELVRGLRTLDEVGAVIVDLLRPPTFDTLVEAARNGGYHMLVFYGHGAYGVSGEAPGGHLLFEDECGGGELIQSAHLGAALRNTEVRLILLGACQSAQVGMDEDAGWDVWSATAPALLRAGVPLAIGMQVSMRVDAALAFIRQFALSLAAGKTVVEAVGDARLPLIRKTYGETWFIPALYGRPSDEYRLFDPGTPLPEDTAVLRAEMKKRRAEIVRLEETIGDLGMLSQPGEIARLRAAKAAFARARSGLARRTPGPSAELRTGGYASVVSPLYGVPSNPVFVGRSGEMREVCQELRGRQPVVIWGAGGIGKTALATEIAHRQGWRFPAGVLWLDCRGGPAFDTLLDRIGAFCGVVDMQKVEPARKEMTVRGALAGLDESCLLVWDNAEDVWDERAVRRFAEALPPNCQALLTTRQDPERATWPTIELRPLLDEAMTTLFYRLASDARVKVGTRADVEAVPHIIGWLEGHPLALMLAVPLIKKRGLKRVWIELQQHPLKGVEAAFELSYARLSDAQRRLFARLSVFTIPFEWETAAALLPDEPGVDDALDVLVNQALINFDGARYAYHSLLRQYAYARLRDLGDSRPVHRLAAEYLGTKLADPERGGTPEEALEAVDQWERAEAWEEFAQRASALVGSLDRLGYWGEIRQRLERALAAVREPAGTLSELEVGLLGDLASITYKSAEWDQAISLWEETVNLYQESGNEEGMAGTYNNLGNVYADKGEWERAIEFYQNALGTMERVGDIHGMAGTYNNLGSVYARKGEWERAIEFYQKSLETKERVGDMHGMAHTYGNLGAVYMQKGEWERAIEFYQKSLETKERVGDMHGMAQTYNNLGLVYARKGEWERAIEFYQKSLEISERVGDIHGMAVTFMNIGNVNLQQGKWDEAIQAHERSLEIREQVGDMHGMAQTYGNLGLVYADKGEWDRAIEFYQNALGTMERVGDIQGVAYTSGNLGLIYLERGRLDEAEDLFRYNLEVSRRLGDVHSTGLAFNALGQVFERRNDNGQSALYFAQAFLVFQHLGSPSANSAAQSLVRVCGSPEAANAYLAQMAEDEAAEVASPAQGEEGITLEQLLGYVAQACRGNAELGEQLWPLVQTLAADEDQPPETRALGQVLRLILAGERQPDLSALPPELAQAIQEMLDSL